MFMDEAGLPEESHESLKVTQLACDNQFRCMLYTYIGVALSLGSTRSSICWHHKSRLGCSKN